MSEIKLISQAFDKYLQGLDAMKKSSYEEELETLSEIKLISQAFDKYLQGLDAMKKSSYEEELETLPKSIKKKF